MRINRLEWVALALVAGTGLTWWLGEAGATRLPPWATVPLIFALAFVKGRWVLLDFMALRTAPALWRRLMLGWLMAVVGLIVAIHQWAGAPP